MKKKIKVDNPNDLPTVTWEQLEDLQMDFKTITWVDLNKLKSSIIKHGIFLPKFVWEHGGKFWTLDGHQTKRALMELEGEYDVPELPIVKIKAKNKKDAIEKLLVINSRYGKVNRKTEIFDFYDFDFEDLVGEIEIPELKLELIMMDETEEDNQVPEKVKSRTEPGDLWSLGPHRILCADSTKQENVGKLLQGQQADMMFTDPPYLMRFVGSVRGTGEKSFNAQYQDIENDQLDNAEAGIFLSRIALVIKEYVAGAFYICFYRLGIEKIINALQQNDLQYRSLIIWHKNNHSLSNSDYQNIYDPIIYGWNEKHDFYGERNTIDFMTAKKDKNGSPSITTQGRSVYLKVGGVFHKFEVLKRKPKNYIELEEEQKVIFNIFNGENNIWEVNKVLKSDLHPTMKPVELCERGILNSSQPKQTVLDPFLGSGTTLIACQKTNRICYGIEMDPHYCDITIDRYKAWCKANEKPYNIKRNDELVEQEE